MASAQRRIQGYDTFKLIVAVGLLILILLCLLTGAPFPAAAPTPPTTTATATSTAAAIGLAPSPTPAPSATPTLITPQAQAEVTDGRLTLSGAGTPGSTVRIRIDGQPAGEVTVGADGRWTFAADLAPGDHAIALEALDAAGQVAASGQPLSVQAPEPIAAPALDPLPAGLAAGVITVNGAGTPGSTVRVLVDGQPAGEAVVGPDGRWTLEADLASGRHTLTAEALDEAGQTVAASEPMTMDVLAATAADAPTLDPITGSPRVGPVTLGGAGAPGSRVQIVIDGQVVGEAAVGLDGRWTFDANFTAAGDHTVVVNALDAAGSVTAAGRPATLTVAAPSATPTPAPAAGAGAGDCRLNTPDTFGEDLGQVWRVERCDTLSYIARQTGINLSDLITANPHVLDPDLIFPGQLITLPGR